MLFYRNGTNLNRLVAMKCGHPTFNTLINQLTQFRFTVTTTSADTIAALSSITTKQPRQSSSSGHEDSEGDGGDDGVHDGTDLLHGSSGIGYSVRYRVSLPLYTRMCVDDDFMKLAHMICKIGPGEAIKEWPSNIIVSAVNEAIAVKSGQFPTPLSPPPHPRRKMILFLLLLSPPNLIPPYYHRFPRAPPQTLDGMLSSFLSSLPASTPATTTGSPPVVLVVVSYGIWLLRMSTKPNPKWIPNIIPYPCTNWSH